MSVLWVLPLVVIGLGAVVAAVAVRRTAAATAELAQQAHGLAVLGRETAALRTDVLAAVARGRALRHRATDQSG